METNVKKSNNNSILLVSMFTALVGSVLMLVSLLLPYITGGYGDIQSYSMVSYVKLAFDEGNKYAGTSVFGVIMLVMVIIIGLFSLLSFVFSLARKPIPVLIFTVLACIAFCVQCWDFTDRGVIGENALSWGSAFYAFIIGVIIALAGAVFMLIQKIRIKKQEV